MKTIRKAVFETNSSSTHSICIAYPNEDDITLPEHVEFKCGEFGWGISKLDSVEDKASYLYTAMLCIKTVQNIEMAKRALAVRLKEIGVTCEFATPKYDSYGCYKFYIDHPEDTRLKDFVNKVLYDKGRLVSYLFSPKSYVLTGNDNDDEDVGVNESYPHEYYYKGN